MKKSNALMLSAGLVTFGTLAIVQAFPGESQGLAPPSGPEVIAHSDNTAGKGIDSAPPRSVVAAGSAATSQLHQPTSAKAKPWAKPKPASASTQALAAQLLLERSILAPGRQTVTGLLKLTGGKASLDAQAQPTAWALVVDVSSSMSGDKIADARHAVRQLIKGMGQNDRLTLIGFSTDSRTLLSNAVVGTGDSKERLLTAVRALTASGATCISCGMKLGQAGLHEAPTTHQRRMVLLSDGHANFGKVTARALGQAAADLKKRDDVTVSAVGIGGGFSVKVVSAIAERGQGIYHFVAHRDDLDEVAAKELRVAKRIAARKVSVVFRSPDGALLDDKHGNVSVGSLAAGSESRLLVPFTLGPDSVGTVLVAEVSYEEADGSRRTLTVEAAVTERTASIDAIEGSANPEVIAHLQRLAAADAMTAALKAKQAGDTKGAVELLDQAITTLGTNAATADDPTIKLEKAELEYLKDNVQKLKAGSAQLEAVTRDNGVREQRAKQGRKADKRRKKGKRKFNASYF